MQELMVGTNRLPPRRVTALGGGLIGLILGILVSYGTFAVMLHGQRNEATNQMAQLRAEGQKKLDEQSATNRAQMASLTGVPSLFLSHRLESNALELRKIMDQFPAFKTDPYKQLFTDLTGLVDEQRAQARSLITALSDPGLESGARCRTPSTPLVGDPLWSREGASFAKDGWRGVSP